MNDDVQDLIDGAEGLTLGASVADELNDLIESVTAASLLLIECGADGDQAWKAAAEYLRLAADYLDPEVP